MRAGAPADSMKPVGALLDKLGCAWDAEDPSQEEYPEVPVKLKTAFSAAHECGDRNVLSARIRQRGPQSADWLPFFILSSAS